MHALHFRSRYASGEAVFDLCFADFGVMGQCHCYQRFPLMKSTVKLAASPLSHDPTLTAADLCRQAPARYPTILPAIQLFPVIELLPAISLLPAILLFVRHSTRYHCAWVSSSLPA